MLKDRRSVRAGMESTREREREREKTQDMGGETLKSVSSPYTCKCIYENKWAGAHDPGGQSRHIRLYPNNLPPKGECAFKQDLLVYN